MSCRGTHLHNSRERMHFIHQTGGMFLSIEFAENGCPFFFWTWNHMLTGKQWQQQR